MHWNKHIFGIMLYSTSILSKNIEIQIYKSIILPGVLYAHETWSLTLREEHRLRVFENTVLIRIFGPKRDEVTGKWRKLHNKELNDLHSSPNIIRVIKLGRMRCGAPNTYGVEQRCIQGFGRET
jgi:hypothetical protein